MPALASNSGLVVFSMFVLVLGYVAIGGLFYLMIYRPRKQEKEAAKADAERESAGAPPER